MPRRWATAKKQPSAAEQSVTRRTQARANCQQGKHNLSKTFRPGEHICIVCNVVFYCPACITQYDLPPVTSKHAYVLECSMHQKAKVQA